MQSPISVSLLLVNWILLRRHRLVGCARETSIYMISSGLPTTSLLGRHMIWKAFTLLSVIFLAATPISSVNAQTKTSPECNGITGAQESANLIFFGSGNPTQYALCGVVYLTEDGCCQHLLRIELRTRTGTTPFVTRHVAGFANIDAAEAGKATGSPFSISDDAMGTTLWVTKGTVTYVLYDCSNPRLCGDDDDLMSTLSGGSISKSRCGRVDGFLSPQGKSVACDLTDRIQNELQGDETTISFDGEGSLSFPKNLSHIFKKTTVLPAAIEKATIPQ